MRKIILLSVCLFMSILPFRFCFSESYNYFSPAIDTYFTDQFDENKFDNVGFGFDTATVIYLIGRPFDVQQLGDSAVLWYYTKDGKCSWMDFAWLGRQIIFDKKGRVKKTYKSIYYD